MTTAGASTVGTFFAEPRRRLIDGRDVEWFEPTDHARGPWDVDACHAGPPTGLLARAMERALPDVRLTRITVDLAKPVPMAGFFVRGGGGPPGADGRGDPGEHRRRRRRGSGDGGGVAPRAQRRSRGRHLARQLRHRDAAPRRHHARPVPHRRDAPRAPRLHRDAVQMRYPDGDLGAASTTAWMRTSPLLPGEAPSPFQRICPSPIAATPSAATATRPRCAS